MRIHDLEVRTGLERATIRFYEKENLISPQRSDNGYRLYTQADADDLMKIKLLRQLGMTLEQIRAIKQGSGDFSQALESQAHILGAQIDSKCQAAEVCKEMRAANVTYQDLDADYYLTRLTQLPKAIPSGQAPGSGSFREPQTRQVHPVRRYVARLLDVNILSAAVSFLLFFVLRLRPVPTGFGSTLMIYAMWLLSLPYEALLLHFLGTTPGKWIMGIRLEYIEGGKLSFSQALSRAWQVFTRGMGCRLIALYTCWRLYKSYKAHTQTGDMEWDDQTEVHYSPWDDWRKTLLAFAICVVAALTIAVYQDSTLPPNRAERLTVAQFAENYNFYHTVFDGSVNGRLLSDGTRYKAPDYITGNYTVMVPQEEYPEFTFQTENGNIRSITYRSTWNHISFGSLMFGDHYTAAVTAILSQPGVNYTDIENFDGEWNAAVLDPTITELIFGDITIRWNVATENCDFLNGYYQTLDEDQPSSLSLDFEIIYNSS